MAKGEGAKQRSKPVLLVGGGNRPKELGAVLAALGAVRAQQPGAALEPYHPLGLADLEELLAQRPAMGTLILDYERVPGEDIGFVRRFLERHLEWRLVVVGEDVTDRRARGLLALPRTHCLPWPPDLDQISALLPVLEGDEPSPGPRSSQNTVIEPRERAETGERRAKKPRAMNPKVAAPVSAKPVGPELDTVGADGADGPELDVGALIEELLAGASLAGGSTPRYLYRCSSSVTIRRDRNPLTGVLETLLDLARACAGGTGVVSAQVDGPAESTEGVDVPATANDSARIRIDFPAGALRPEDWPVLFEAPIKVAKEMSAIVKRAAAAAEKLVSLGGRIVPATLPQDRLRLEIFIASGPLPIADTPIAATGRPASAQDPFA